MTSHTTKSFQVMESVFDDVLPEFKGGFVNGNDSTSSPILRSPIRNLSMGSAPMVRGYLLQS
jgi:hypothetical protein